MTSDVNICNMALSHIRADSINAFTDATNEATQCKLFYPVARDFLLENNPYVFTTVDEPLNLLAEKPARWSYAYAYPPQCEKLRNIYTGVMVLSEPVLFEVGVLSGAKVIMTDVENACIQYTRNTEDPTLYPASFRIALSHYLASLLAVPVIGKGKEAVALQDVQLRLYQNTISQSIGNDATERYSGPRPDSEMITVREG